MAIALSDEHQALSMSVRGWLASHCPPSVPRALLDAEVEELQPIWKEMAAEGWLGIHLPEEFGGQGFGLFELAVVLEETGRSMVPGPAPAHGGHLGAGVRIGRPGSAGTVPARPDRRDLAGHPLAG